MEIFSALLALCAGNTPVTGEFPAQRPVTRCFGVFFDLRLNKQLVDLRRYRAHYDVTVMIYLIESVLDAGLLLITNREAIDREVGSPTRQLTVVYQRKFEICCSAGPHRRHCTFFCNSV